MAAIVRAIVRKAAIRFDIVRIKALDTTVMSLVNLEIISPDFFCLKEPKSLL